MKCTCAHCEGEGIIEVQCSECNGTGQWETSILELTVTKHTKNAPELLALKGDANRVIAQANQLCQMNPDRAESYRKQLSATLATIEKQAEAAAKKN